MPLSSSPITLKHQSLCLLFGLAIVLCSLGTAHGQFTWNGNTDAAWSTGTNWTGTAPASSGSGSLNFDNANLTGSLIRSTNNDLTNLTATGITLANGTTTNAFTLAGNQITLGGDISTSGASGTTTHIISLNLSLSNTITLNLANAKNLTISGLISETGGSRSLIKSNAGTVTLSNTGNSFTGALSVNRAFVNASSIQPSGQNSAIGAGSVINFGSSGFVGTLTITGSTAPTGAINRDINLADGNGGTFTNDSSNPLTLNGTFSNMGSVAKIFTLGGTNTGANEFASTLVNSSGGGALTLVKAGAGSWTLSGPNTYTGSTQINTGTINVSTIADSGSSNLGLGTALRLGNTTTTGTLNYTGSGNTTARTLQIGANSATPVATDTGAGTINNNGASGALVFTATTFNPQQTNATTGVGANRVLTLGGSNTAANEISGTIQNNLVSGSATGTATVALTKANAGRWILAGANTYTGLTTVSGGVLQLNHATALPGGIGATGGTSALTLSSGVLGLGNGDFTRALGTGTDQVNIAADNSGFAAYGADRIVNLGGASTAVTWASGSFMTAGNNFMLSHSTATHMVDFQNPIVLAGTRFIRVEDGAAAVDARLSGSITGSTTFSKAGAGTLELTNTSNAWTGGTFIDSGTLRLGAANVLPGTGVELKRAAATDTNAVLDLNGFSETIGGITLGITAASATNNGQTPSIINSGGGTPILTLGGDIIYRSGLSGAFANGQATISANLATGNATRNINVGDGSAVNDLVISGAISGSGTLNKQGLGTLLLSGTNTYSGLLQLQQGTVKLGNAGVLPDASNLQLGVSTSTTSVVVDLNGFSETVNGVILGSSLATVGGLTHSLVNSGAAAVLTLGSDVTYNAGPTGFLNGQSTISANLAAGAANRIFSVGDGAATDDLVVSGAISGSVVLTKNGAGTLLLSGANTYTGQVNVQQGTVKLGANNVLPDAVTNVIQLGINGSTSGVVLDINGFSDTVGPLRLNGASGGNPSSPGLTHSIIDSAGGGVLTLGNTFNVYAGGANQYGQATISANLNTGNPIRNLTVENSSLAPIDLLISGTVVGSNGFVKQGAGTLALSAANTFTGVTMPNTGVLLLQNNLALQNSALDANTGGTGTVTLDTGITTPTLGGLSGTRDLSAVMTSGYSSVTALTLNPNAGSVTYAGVIADGATGMNLIKTGAGTQVFTGTNSYTGTTTVSGGILQVGNLGVGTTGTGAVTVQTGGTLLGTGIVRGTSFTVDSGAIVHAGDGMLASNLGTLTFTPTFGTTTTNFASGSTTFLGLDFTTPTNSDKLLFTSNGTLIFNGNLSVGPASFTPTSAAVFQLLDWMNIGTTSFNSRYNFSSLLQGNGDEASGFDLPDISSGLGLFAWDISNFTTNGSIAIVVVPEPSRTLLLLLSCFAVFARRRR